MAIDNYREGLSLIREILEYQEAMMNPSNGDITWLEPEDSPERWPIALTEDQASGASEDWHAADHEPTTGGAQDGQHASEYIQYGLRNFSTAPGNDWVSQQQPRDVAFHEYQQRLFHRFERPRSP